MRTTAIFDMPVEKAQELLKSHNIRNASLKQFDRLVAVQSPDLDDLPPALIHTMANQHNLPLVGVRSRPDFRLG